MLKASFFGIGQVNFGTESETTTLTGRIQALFTYLCVTHQPQDRGKLGDLLWDNLSEQEAKRNLRYILRDLRKIIGDYLIVDGQTISFNFELPYWFDVTSFTTYLSPRLRNTAESIELTILQELLNLYTGDFLAGFHIQDASNFERWMLAQRRHFHDAMVYGLQLATQQHLTQGEYDAGLALNQYLLTLEPWREEAHRQRMILLAANGQRSAALMQYELCCQVLEEELDVPPMTETTSLYTQIKSGMWFIEQEAAAEFNRQRVAVRAYPQVPTYPQASTAIEPATPPKNSAAEAIVPQTKIDLGTMPTTRYFTGRDKELFALQRWLDDDDVRLAAILGLPGQGKSSLAAWFVQEQCTKLNLASSVNSFLSTDQQDSQYVAHWPIAPSPTTDNHRQPPTTITKIVWRSLAQGPSCIALLQDIIQQLDDNVSVKLSNNFDQLATRLFELLQKHRSLIVLDGIENILSNNTVEQQREAERYEHLFRLFIERQHRSCLLLTSRIRPTMLTHRQQQQNLVHWLELDGLTQEDSEEYLKALGLETEPSGYQQMHDRYAGNPQMLGQVADLIHDLFMGDVAAFLQEEVHFLSNIGSSMTQQITQLSSLERRILQNLIETAQPLSLQKLWETLPTEIQKNDYYSALRELQRAHLVRQTNGQIQVTTLPATFLTEQKSLLRA